MIHLVSREESAADRPLIGSLATGVQGLDVVLRGGIPEFSFNLVAGGPGAGKTTLAQQIVFHNATVERPALYFTVLGEPTLKMIRYQRQFRFFRPDLVGSAVRFINLTEEVLRHDLAGVLKRIVDEVEQSTPALVVVDSFRTLGLQSRDGNGADALGLEQFVQRLALHLTTWEVTSFLIGEYVEPELQNPVFTVADGILLVVAGPGPQFGRPQGPGGQGSRALVDAGAPHLSDLRRRHPGLPTYSGAAGSETAAPHRAARDRRTGTRCDDGRRIPRGRRGLVDRSGRQR